MQRNSLSLHFTSKSSISTNRIMLSAKLHLTPTWLEHATFWSGVRRATIAPQDLVLQGRWVQWKFEFKIFQSLFLAKFELGGIEPRTYHMRSEHSTYELQLRFKCEYSYPGTGSNLNSFLDSSLLLSAICSSFWLVQFKAEATWVATHVISIEIKT